MISRISLPSALLAAAFSTSVVSGNDDLKLPEPEKVAAATAAESAQGLPDPIKELAEPVSLLASEGLAGWIVHEGMPKAWERDGDVISCLSAGAGWLRTEAVYSDFELELEYRLTPGANTGIGIRTPEEGNPTFAGFEIQLIDEDAEKYRDLRPDQRTGSIYYQVPAQKKAPQHPPGEWNHCHVRCVGDQLTITINGEVVNEVDLVASGVRPTADGSESPARFQLSQRPPLGHLALQGHSSRVDFRNLQVRDLSVSKESGLQFVELADGDGETIAGDEVVMIHYVGQLPSGKRFTNTRDLGEAVEVPLTKVIPGLREGITGMKVGGRRRLIVPPGLGYGSQGVENVIPPSSTLVFEVELCGVRR